MDISSIFNAAIPGITGVSTDVYTAAIAMVVVLVIAFGVGTLYAFLTQSGEKEKTGAFTEAEFQDYAVKRYKKELYEKTYKSRGIGKSEDV